VMNKGGSKVYVMSHIPSKKSMKKMKRKIKEHTSPRNKLLMNIKELVKGLNPNFTRI
jgi:RNA-directed DNA polymerase